MSGHRIPFTAARHARPQCIMSAGGRVSRDRKVSKRKQDELDSVADEADERAQRRAEVAKRAKRPAVAAFVPLPSGTRVQAKASSFGDSNWAKSHFGNDRNRRVLYGTLVRYEDEGTMLVAEWDYDHEEYPLKRGKVKVAAATAPVKSVQAAPTSKRGAKKARKQDAAAKRGAKRAPIVPEDSTALDVVENMLTPTEAKAFSRSNASLYAKKAKPATAAEATAPLPRPKVLSDAVDMQPPSNAQPSGPAAQPVHLHVTPRSTPRSVKGCSDSVTVSQSPGEPPELPDWQFECGIEEHGPDTIKGASALARSEVTDS